MQASMRLGAIIMLVLVALAPAVRAASWSGTVTDADTAAGIAAATVTLWGPGFPLPRIVATASSQSDGAFVLTADVEVDNSYSFSVQRAGYVELRRPAPEVDPAAAHFALQREARLDVTVVAAEDGEPVFARVAAGNRVAWANPQSPATFRLEPGDYTVCAQQESDGRLRTCLDGHEPGWTGDAGPELTLLPGQHATVVIASRRGAVLTGSITTLPSGRAAPAGAYAMRFFDEDGIPLGERSFGIGAENHYVIAGLPDGQYRLQLKPSSAYIRFHEGQLFPGIDCGDDCPIMQGDVVELTGATATSGIDFALTSQASISGQLASAESGLPVADAEVTLSRHIGWIVDWSIIATVRSSADGSYHFDLLQPALGVRLGARAAPGHRAMSWPAGACCWHGTTVTTQAGEHLDGFDFLLQPGPAIAGRVVARGSGRPLDAEIDIRNISGYTIWNGRTRPDGTYQSPALAAGSYRVLASYFWQVSPTTWEGDCVAYPANPCNSGDAIAIGETVGANGIDIVLATPDVFASGFE